ncbi:putative toxin-antitoxin system toxin component, PIN family [Succinivibrio sp.]|uniref:putative toxin-antitoxin system toxin component, PIN family n=1 Tax=Succinivibrio sp. TaxID=2053619 RepID=UPI0025D0A3B9|nr:putative toxin-antitoxin system toxin component, PIN family [Succinivibrio sp.]MBQ9220395.1 putative toxin-antitoxin system toxin component, PIN family [Succinivibrio sp.]
MKILVDTNIIVSGLLWNNKESLILKEIFKDNFDAVVSPEIIDEYKHGLTKALYKTDREFNYDFTRILKSFSVIESKSRIYICRDPKDNKFLECAYDARAYYIVSGDKDLISIKKEVKDYFDIEIITAKAFCEKFNLNEVLDEENSNSFHR